MMHFLVSLSQGYVTEISCFIYFVTFPKFYGYVKKGYENFTAIGVYTWEASSVKMWPWSYVN